MYKVKAVFAAIIIAFLALSSQPAKALDNEIIQARHTKLVGKNKMPVTVTTVFKGKAWAGLAAWVVINYKNDRSLPAWYLPASLKKMDIGGKEAVAFKTWLDGGYQQNVAVEQKDTVKIYSAPYGVPKDNCVLAKVLGAELTDDGLNLPSAEDNCSACPADVPAREADAGIFKALTISTLPFGSLTGTFNGVPAYSDYLAPSPALANYVNGYFTGGKWACVEYASRYYYIVYKRKIAGGSANWWYANAAVKGLKRAPNGGTIKPKVGNIICAVRADGRGHLAIVRAVGTSSVTLAQQNLTSTASDIATVVPMKVTWKGTAFTYYLSPVGAFSVQGWLW